MPTSRPCFLGSQRSLPARLLGCSLMAVLLLPATSSAFDLGTLAGIARQAQHARPPAAGDEPGGTRAGGPPARFDASDVYSREQLSSTFDGCKELFPQARPLPLSMVDRAWKTRGLCSDQFAVLYSGLAKSPLVVVEKLNRQHLAQAKGNARTDNFFPDPRLPRSERAELADFKGSGFDRGHMASAADQAGARAMNQSFALSNMVMQNSFNNQKTWNKLEQDTRKYAMRAGGDVYVYTGPIFDAGYSTMGRGKVWVPTRLFKLVYDEASGRAWAHIVDNAEVGLSRPVDYPAFVQATGLRLLDGLPVR